MRWASHRSRTRNCSSSSASSSVGQPNAHALYSHDNVLLRCAIHARHSGTPEQPRRTDSSRSDLAIRPCCSMVAYQSRQYLIQLDAYPFSVMSAIRMMRPNKHTFKSNVYAGPIIVFGSKIPHCLEEQACKRHSSCTNRYETSDGLNAAE